MLLDSSHLENDERLQHILKSFAESIVRNKLKIQRPPSCKVQTLFDPHYIGLEYLEQLQSRSGDPLDTNEVSDIYYVDKQQIEQSKLLSVFWSHYPSHTMTLTGHFLYKPQGFMGWHTNAGAPGTRVYITYAVEGDRSFFRYQDPLTKVIHDSVDKQGWNIRTFSIDPSLPFWHCVYSDTDRYSFGVKLLSP